MERQFEQQLEKLKTRILKMCSLVDEQVDLAIRAIDEENPALAEIVLEKEKKVDKYDIKIDKICQKIFALNQPVAMDLRLIMSALTINTNLERMGDIAVNIVENRIGEQIPRAHPSRERVSDHGPGDIERRDRLRRYPAGRRKMDRKRLMQEARFILARQRLRHALRPRFGRKTRAMSDDQMREPE